ncbi:MAG: transposase domain-containing protein, partial [Litorilituus sp.]|nr:transposase domain-containing protein [Litorilituus sp.]
MELSKALDFIAQSSPNNIETLCDILPLELIKKSLKQTDTVTFRKRKLPLESMVWLVIGMDIYNDKPISQIINMLDIEDRDKKAFVAPSAVIQRRQDLGVQAIESVFD